MTNLKDIYSDTISKMEKSLEMTVREFSRIRTGRASPVLVQGVKVNAYNSTLPLSQVAGITCPEPRLIVIRPWDNSLVPEIEKAIYKSEIGITPSTDGNVIRLNIPPLSEERRKELVKLVKRIGEEGKVSIRNIRREAMEEIKNITEISEDEKKRAEKEIQNDTDKFIEKTSNAIENKEHEIMEE